MKKAVASMLLVTLLSPCVLADDGFEGSGSAMLSSQNALVDFQMSTADSFESVEGIFSRVLDYDPLWDRVRQTMFA